MAAEKTTIKHILTTPAHQLELLRGGRKFVCYKCAVAGTGPRYRCNNCDDMLLHLGCASVTITHTLQHVAGAEGLGFFCKQCTEIGTGEREQLGFFLHRGCTGATASEESQETEEGNETTVEDERRALQDEKKKLDEEKTNVKEEKKKLEEERTALQDEKKKLEEEKRLFQEEKQQLDDEKRVLEKEKKKQEEEEEEEETVESMQKKTEDVQKYIGSLATKVIYFKGLACSSTYASYVGIWTTMNSSEDVWCNSGGGLDKEWLVYGLRSGICSIVDEIQFWHMACDWSYRVQIGYAKSDNDYAWFYTSPVQPLPAYDMSQKEYICQLESYKLPTPVPCINGGVVKIEFIKPKHLVTIRIREVGIYGRQLEVDKTKIQVLQRLFPVVVEPLL